MSKTVLVTRPEYDPTTRYLSQWAGLVIDLAGKLGHKVIDLARNRATRKELESVIRKTGPGLVFANGHGDDDLVCGQDGEVLVQAGDNERMFAGRVVNVLSCRSAKKLGPSCIKVGAKAYIGYAEDFVFYRENGKLSRPLEDTTAAHFFNCSNQVASALVKGRTPQDAYLNSQASYKRTIRELITRPDESHLLRFLIWDMQAQVCLEPPLS